MIDKLEGKPKEKLRLHSRNKHREQYDLKQLTSVVPELEQFVTLNIYNNLTIDFFNPNAVKALNKALLKQFYNIDNWDIPENYLCPPIPGRADYIHHIAELLCQFNFGKIPTGNNIHCLDIGVGANCVYPIIGNAEYGWHFVGSDIDAIAIQNANIIIKNNTTLLNTINIRLQTNKHKVFLGIVKDQEKFDITLCNPPFHSSLAEAHAGTLRKLSNLRNEKITTPTQNFGGQNNELWCNGGEARFVSDMILESKHFAKQCFWFTTIISKQTNLKRAYAELKNANVCDVKTLPMGQGNKISRIVAWTYLNKEERNEWAKSRWNRA